MKYKNVFTFDEAIQDNSDFINDPYQQEDNLKYSVQDIGKIEQPPFFRTAEINRTIFPSKSYSTLRKSILVHKSFEYQYDETSKRFKLHKPNPNKITFVGVDAVVYDEHQPSTSLIPCSREECDAIFNKKEREAFIVVEDEETMRNDTLLDEIDNMDEEEELDTIPTSQLRQYLHNYEMTDSLRDRLFHSAFDSPSSLSSVLSEEEIEEPEHLPPKSKSVANPVHFTFDDIPDDLATVVDPYREEEEFPSFSHTPLNNGEKIEPIPLESDSLSEDTLSTKRLTLTDIESISTQRSRLFRAQNLRSPRLYDCQTPRQNDLQTPRCVTGPMGAATVNEKRVSFFHSVNSPPQPIKKVSRFDYSSPVIRSLTLTDRISEIRAFCKTTNRVIIRHQKQLARVAGSEGRVLELYNAIIARSEKNSQIDAYQLTVNDWICELANRESEYSILKVGYRDTFSRLQSTVVEEKVKMMNMLECFGWQVKELDIHRIGLYLPLRNADIMLTILPNDFVTIQIQMIIQSADPMFKKKLEPFETKECMYHELYEYLQKIWYTCMEAESSQER